MNTNTGFILKEINTFRKKINDKNLNNITHLKSKTNFEKKKKQPFINTQFKRIKIFRHTN